MELFFKDADGVRRSVNYESEEEKRGLKGGRKFVITDIPEELEMGSSYSFYVWSSGNITEVPLLEDGTEKGEEHKQHLVQAVCQVNGIEYP